MLSVSRGLYFSFFWWVVFITEGPQLEILKCIKCFKFDLYFPAHARLKIIGFLMSLLECFQGFRVSTREFRKNVSKTHIFIDFYRILKVYNCGLMRKVLAVLTSYFYCHKAIILGFSLSFSSLFLTIICGSLDHLQASIYEFL